MAESLGSAVALTAVLGDKIGQQVDRDQNAYFNRVQRGMQADAKSKAAADKLVTIKDFKPTGDLLPQYAYRVAQAQANFANEFQQMRTEHGDRAAVNMAWQKRQDLDQFAINQKTLSDQAAKLINTPAGDQVPNLDKIKAAVMKWGDAKNEFSAVNDQLSGTTGDYETGAVTASPYKNVDFRDVAMKDWIAKQAPQGIYKDGGTVGDKKMRYHQYANTDQDAQEFSKDILHNQQYRDAFIHQNREDLIKENPTILTEKDPQKQQTMLENSAVKYAKSLLTPTWKMEEGVVPRQTESERTDQWVPSENYVEKAPPGQQTDLISGNHVARYAITRSGGKDISFVATPQVSNKETGEAIPAGTGLTGKIQQGITKPIYGSDGKLKYYEPYANVLVTNHRVIEDYLNAPQQKALYDQAATEVASRVTQGVSDPNKRQDALNNISQSEIDQLYLQKRAQTGLPVDKKVAYMVEVPASNIAGGFGSPGYKQLLDLTQKANDGLAKGARKYAITKDAPGQKISTKSANPKGKKKIAGF